MSDSDSGQSTRVPACTRCVRRKTKCDRKSPCASCMAAKVQCEYIRKQPKKKQRILLSSRYEENLSHIKERIEALSDTVQLLAHNVESMDRRLSAVSALDSASTAVHTTLDDLCGSERAGAADQHRREAEQPLSSSLSETLGDTSPTALSGTANTTNAQAAAIDIVQALIQDARGSKSAELGSDPSQSTTCAFSQYPELASLDLPPMDYVLRLLAFARRSPQRYFIDIPHSNEEYFAELCQKIYFPTQPFTIFAWTAVNCGLFFLFRDLDKDRYDELRLTQNQVFEAVAVCSRNVDRAAKSLRLCINPSYEAVDALICAAAVNMECANGRLSWRLVSASARMCVDLGYHCLPSGPGDHQKSQQRKLFWYVYALDKSLAFNFGRSPTIQDIDVTTDRPTYSEDFKSKWGLSFLAFIDFTRVQYDVYEQLFSARSHQDPMPIRIHKAHGFAARVSQMRDDFKEVLRQGDVPYQGTVREAGFSVDIGFSSMLTLIYRVLPPNDSADAQVLEPSHVHPLDFHPLCIEAGRSALNALVCGWKAVSAKHDEDGAKIFIKWTSLFIPFMPFIAVFGNQILTGDREDLKLLRDVFEIIQSAAEVSSTMNKICGAFSQLFKIAELWTTTSNGKNQNQNQARNLQQRSSVTPVQVSCAFSNDQQRSSHVSMRDVHMTAPSPSMLPFQGWQDLDLSRQNWDLMFNEFDLGLGAENAREIMPWFEQHLSDFNTFS